MDQISKALSLIVVVSILVNPVVGIVNIEGERDVTATFSELVFSSDPLVSIIGYTVNGESNVDRVLVTGGDVVTIQLNYLPSWASLNITLSDGVDALDIACENGLKTLPVAPHSEAVSLSVYLHLVGENPNPTPPPTVNPDDNPSGGGGVPDTPSEPDVPTEPENPDNPPVEPDTPGSDEPGSDEPYRPILPPAGWVKNFAGFIPLAAGFLLLFLVFFWRRKVYRILNAHAKKHGEKPEKEHLKEIADAIIKLVRDEGRYPEWKKNSDVAKRLSADIVSVLDEMNYPKIVPRGALVAEIIKAARGKINKHRL